MCIISKFLDISIKKIIKDQIFEIFAFDLVQNIRENFYSEKLKPFPS